MRAAATPKNDHVPQLERKMKPKMTPKGFLRILKAAFYHWNDESGARLGAALSYYTAFSVAPLLLLAIAIAGFAFGREAAEGEIAAQMSGLMGPQSATTLQNIILAAQKPAAGAAAAVISIISLLIGASGVMTEMKSALNRIWGVPDRGGFSGFMISRVEAVGMILAIGFLLLVSLTASAVLAALGKYLETVLPLPEWSLQILNLVVSFASFTVVFAMLLKILPDADIRWHDVGVGSVVTSTLFIIGKTALGFYLGKGIVGSSYGAAGSLLIILAWVYYSAQIFYFGAAFTRIYANRYGSGIHRPIGQEAVVPNRPHVV